MALLPSSQVEAQVCQNEQLSLQKLTIWLLVGIGKMMTIALAENGARKVYIVGRRADKLNEIAAKYPK